MASNNSSERPTEEADGDSSARKPNWLELPRDVTANILQRVGAVEIVKSARNVCSLWWNICKDPLMWRTIDMRWRSIRTLIHSRYQLRAICRYVVDQSRGNLESISISDFANDKILEHIAARASHLRRLALDGSFSNYEVSNAGVLAILDSCPLLESLHLDDTMFLLDDSLFERCKEQVKDFQLHNSQDDRSEDDSFGDRDDSYDTSYSENDYYHHPLDSGSFDSFFEKMSQLFRRDR